MGIYLIVKFCILSFNKTFIKQHEPSARACSDEDKDKDKDVQKSFWNYCDFKSRKLP